MPRAALGKKIRPAVAAAGQSPNRLVPITWGYFFVILPSAFVKTLLEACPVTRHTTSKEVAYVFAETF